MIILFAFFASPFLGIEALAWGTVVGALMMWLVQVPELTFRRTRYKLTLDLGHPGVREIVRLTLHVPSRSAQSSSSSSSTRSSRRRCRRARSPR